VTRRLLRLGGRRIVEAKQSALAEGAVSDRHHGLLGGGLSSVSPAQVDLWLDDLQASGSHPQRLTGAVSAFAAVTKSMFIAQQSTNEALDSILAPVMVLWGRNDPLVDTSSLMWHARRPGWTPRLLDQVGHLLPVEAPELYVQAVAEWLTDEAEQSGGSADH
jgi:pimeloyl-ACP methyl ester carboxylesterase